MNRIVAKMKWIMLVCGLLTCTMLYVAIAPQAALRSTFGESLEGPLAEIVVRNWGALIVLTGAMLIYGAYRPPSRPLVLTVASLSKLIYSALVLTYGRRFLGNQAGITVGADLAMIVLFGCYLVAIRGQGVPRQP